MGKVSDKNIFLSANTYLINRFIATSLAILAISLVFIYILTAYLGATSIESSLLYSSEDPSWLVPGFKDTQVIGVHRFGDFSIAMSWAWADNPFSTSLHLPSTYGPLQLIMLKPFLFLPIVEATILWELISIILTTWVFFSALKPIGSASFRVIVLVMAVLLTRPFLLLLDRGNIHTVAFLCLAVASFTLLKGEKLWIAEAAIVIGTGVKYYPILLLAVFVAKGNYLRAFRTALLSVAAVIIPMLFLVGGNFIAGVEGILSGAGIQSSAFTSGSSSGAWVSRFLADSSQFTDLSVLSISSKIICLLVSFSLLVISIVGFRKAWLSTSQAIVLVLCAIGMGVPVAYGYTLVWVSIALVILFVDQQWLIGMPNWLKTTSVVGFIPSLVIWPWSSIQAGAVNTGIGEYWTFPFIVFLTIAWVYFGTIRRRTRLVAQ